MPAAVQGETAISCNALFLPCNIISAIPLVNFEAKIEEQRVVPGLLLANIQLSQISNCSTYCMF